jgi:hypothetical protein
MILELVRRLQITQPTNQPKQKQKTKILPSLPTRILFCHGCQRFNTKKDSMWVSIGVVGNRVHRTTRPAQSRAFDPARTFEAGAGAVAGDVGTPAAELEL